MESARWLEIAGYIHLIAGVQGLFLVGLLNGYPSENRYPNRVLSLLIFAFSAILLGTSLGATGLYRTVPHLIRIGDPMVLLLGPSLLLYFTALRLGRVPSVQWGHLVPFSLYVLALLPFYFSTPDEKIAWVEVTLAGSASAWLNVVKVLHVAAYVVWVHVLLVRHAEQVRGFSTDMEETDFQWIRTLTGLLIVTTAAALGTFLLSAVGLFHTALANYLIGLAIAVLIYVMGYAALIKPQVFGDRDYPAWEAPTIWHEFFGSFGFDQDATPDDEYMQREKKLLNKLQSVMEQEAPYRDSNLSLADLSSMVDIPQYLVSRIINEHLDRNFFDFVNEYRVREICARLEDPSQNQFTVLSLAMDAGFNSKSSFYTAFRKSTGLTPTAYKKKHQNGS